MSIYDANEMKYFEAGLRSSVNEWLTHAHNRDASIVEYDRDAKMCIAGSMFNGAWAFDLCEAKDLENGDGTFIVGAIDTDMIDNPLELPDSDDDHSPNPSGIEWLIRYNAEGIARNHIHEIVRTLDDHRKSQQAAESNRDQLGEAFEGFNPNK